MGSATAPRVIRSAGPWHGTWEDAPLMSEPRPTDTDAFLLNLEEHEFIRVGAMLGLRARPATSHDVALVDQFLDGDVLFGPNHKPVLVTSTRDLPPQ